VPVVAVAVDGGITAIVIVERELLTRLLNKRQLLILMGTRVSKRMMKVMASVERYEGFSRR